MTRYRTMPHNAVSRKYYNILIKRTKLHQNYTKLHDIARNYVLILCHTTRYWPILLAAINDTTQYSPTLAGSNNRYDTASSEYWKHKHDMVRSRYSHSPIPVVQCLLFCSTFSDFSFIINFVSCRRRWTLVKTRGSYLVNPG